MFQPDLSQRGRASVDFLADIYTTFGVLHRGVEMEMADKGINAETFPDDSLADDALFGAGRAYQRMWRKPALEVIEDGRVLDFVRPVTKTKKPTGQRAMTGKRC